MLSGRWRWRHLAADASHHRIDAHMLRSPIRFVVAVACLVAATTRSASAAAVPRFEITIASSAHSGPLTGRLVLAIARTAQPEPRLAISPRGPALFAIDLEQLAPNATAVIDDKSLGHPTSLADLPPGDYFAQAVINVYEQVHRSDGKTIWLHMNDGTIEFFSNAAGNLYSDVVPVHVGADGAIKITVTHVIPPAPAVAGHGVDQARQVPEPDAHEVLGAAHLSSTRRCCCPRATPSIRTSTIPSIYTLGHGRTPLKFSTTPPRTGDPNAVSPVTGVQSGYATYQQWSGDAYPRVICISLEQQTPYFADSYSVNSVNNGPYGDAVVQEMIPFLEKQFRIIRQAVRATARGRVDERVAVAGAAAADIRRSSAARGSSSPIRSTSRATR